MSQTGDASSVNKSNPSTSHSSSIPSFCLRNKDGYPTWKFKMRNYLLHEDLWVTISGYPDGDTTPASIKVRNDEKALAKICLTVDGAAITHVRCAKSAAEAWKYLQQAFEDKGMGRRLALERKLYRLSLSDFGNIELYINAVLSTAQDLVDIDVVIDDRSIAAILLGGLTPKYEPLIMALENCNIDVTSDLVKTKLLNEMSKSDAAISIDSAFHAKKKPKSKKKEIICYECQVPGHKRPDCPLRNKAKGNTETAKNTTFTALNTFGRSSKEVFYVDSGCTKHMSFRRDWFQNITIQNKGSVTVANGEQVKCCGIGDISINTPENVINKITDVAFVPDLKANLLSVQKAVDKGLICIFDKNGCNFYKSDNFHFTGDSILHASPCGGLYVVDGTVDVPENVASNHLTQDVHSDCQNISYKLWHKRLGHLCRIGMTQLKNHEVGVKFSEVDKSSCIACVEGKQARKPFKKVAYNRATSPLELIHMDLLGAVSTASFQGNRFMLTIVDDYTRKVFAYFISSKTEVKDKFHIFQTFVENQLQKKIKAVRTDGGKEFVNREFDDYLASKGIHHQTTAPYSSQQVGVAERTHRSITEKARTLLAESSLPKAFWEDAFQVAVYLKNRSPHRALGGQIPEDRWCGSRNDLSHLKVFGCRALVHIPSCHRKKLDVKAKEAIFVGYSENPNTYIFRDPANLRKVITSRDATFFENCFTGLKEQRQSEPVVQSDSILLFDNKESEHDDCQFFDCVESTDPIDELTSQVNVESAEESANMREQEPFFELRLPSADEEPPSLEEERRYPTRNRKTPDFLSYNVSTDDANEPTTYYEATHADDADNWHHAMADEYNSLIKLHTWELVDRPNKKVIPCKWVYKLKKDAYGNVTKYKARLVVKGFNQVKGVDYEETFAPVIRHSSLRTLFALAAEMGLRMKHLDVDTAFLNGNLEEEVFMEQPLGFKAKGKENKVCLLRKSLYGLKQAPRAWNKKLNETLIKIGFTGTPSEPCVYTKLFGEELVILGIFVDDIIVFFKSELTFDIVKKDLSKYFSLKDLGLLKCYLGLQIEYDSESIKINQRNYILSLLDKFNMKDCKTVDTPLVKKNMEKRTDGQVEESYPYQNLIGGLMYLAVNSRPDIAYATSYLSQYNTCYTKEHWNAAKRVLQYLKGTINYSLVYRRGGKPLEGYCDADWANCTIDRRSYTGYVFKLSGGLVSWESKKQPTVALSSAEAEYMALASATKEACYLRRFIYEITGILSSVNLASDSQSAINLVRNPVHHSRTKHIDTRFHFIREKISDNVIMLEYVKTSYMPADVLTKPLGPIVHKRCTISLGLET